MKQGSEPSGGAPAPSGTAPAWTVDIKGKGRCGSVHYREPAGQLTFYWEIGGGDLVASINVGDEASWPARHPWAAGRRAEILRRVADATTRQMSPGGGAEIDDAKGWINLRSGASDRPEPRAR